MNPEDVAIERILDVPISSLPKRLMDLIDFLDLQVRRVPEGFLETSRVFIDIVDKCGVEKANFVITYERPLTEDEKSVLETNRAKALLEREEAEKATLKTLLSKYGVPDEYR